MTLSAILQWWDAHAASLALVLAALTTLARVLWTAVGPRVRARSPRVHAAVETLGALSPDLWRAVTVVLRAHAAARSATPPAAPSGRSGEAGRATVATLALLACVSVLALAACPRVTRDPAVPAPPPGCVAGETVCHEGAPWRCGPGGRWSQADRRCDRIGGVCCLTPSAVAPRSIHACTVPTRCEVL